MQPWERAGGRIGVNAPSWLTFDVHRPYFDGADSGRTAIQARGPLAAAALFERGRPYAPRFGMQMPSSFRRLLIEESRLTAYLVRLPTDLPPALASPGWARMAAAFRARQDLTGAERAGLGQWLTAACLHEAMLEMAPEDRLASRDPAEAMIQFCRAVALFSVEGRSARAEAAFRVLADSPQPTVAHMLAASAWSYLVARHGADDAAAPRYAGLAHRILDDLADRLPPFDRALFRARLLGRDTLHPERHGELDRAWTLLQAAWEAHAAAAPASEVERAVWTEGRRRLIDRQVELAARRGDAAAEDDALRDGVALDPYCIKIRMQEAQAAQRRRDLDRALEGFLVASRLGPFGTAFALLQAADCARRLGQAGFARVLQERAARAQPRSERTWAALEATCVAAGDEAGVAVARRCAARGGAAAYEHNWHYQMYGAYLNLGPSHSPCLYAALPRIAYDFAVAGARPRVDVQRVMPPAFRTNLVRESGLEMFRAERPDDLPREVRTPEWEQLCEWVADFPRADLRRQYLTCNVLFRLGFHRLILDLVPERPVSSLRAPLEFHFYSLREYARYVLSIGRYRAVPDAVFEMPASPACPLDLRLRWSVAAIVYHGRETKSAEAAATWRARAEASLAEVLASDAFTPFERVMLESRAYRGLSFVPFLRGDRAGVIADLDRAESLARAVPAQTPWEHFLKAENLHACLESRSKEAFRLGEIDLGHRRTEEFLALDPYDPKSHIELGESLLKQGRVAEAADAYLRTARLGPIGTAIGYYMAGECFARAGLPAIAEDCYAQTLRLDPYAISAARGWQRVAGGHAFGDLAARYAADLEAWGSRRLSERERAPAAGG